MSPDLTAFVSRLPACTVQAAVRLARSGARLLRRLFSEKELPTTLTNVLLGLALTTLLTGFEAALWLALIATPLVIALLGGAAVVFGREIER